ncbi:hypothetical protein RN001_016317 [Aquatica leii]|uniref:Uncharacterized protein n=1 Tax=Aquatica leii TaxID=1421715 RepID=A0AAN7QBE4_9COLE|nr:hypothetical protein RN001_016317 [Aquatica leii]
MFYCITIIIFVIPTLICQNLENFQQIIRHSRSRNKLLRTSRHGEDFSKETNFNNLTELTFNEQIDLVSMTNNPQYDDGSAVLNGITLENKTVKSEQEALIPLSKDSSQYLTSLRFNTDINVTNAVLDNKNNLSRKVTVDSSSGPILNNSWHGMDKNAISSNAKGKVIDASNHGEDVEELQLQDKFLVDHAQVEVELASEKSVAGAVRSGHVDIVTRFLRIVESQHLLGENCTAGTDLNLGEGVVDRYAQERFRVEADVAVNRANMLTRIWKYADPAVVMSEYFLHASVFSMVEFDNDIFAAGNCYDQYQYKDYWLFCPYAYRLPEGPILVKDLAVEYNLVFVAMDSGRYGEAGDLNSALGVDNIMDIVKSVPYHNNNPSNSKISKTLHYDLKLRYRSTDIGPYFVYVESNNKNIGKLHAIRVGHYLRQDADIRSQISDIISLGRNKISLEFRSYLAANKIITHACITDNNFIAYISKYFVERKEDESEEEEEEEEGEEDKNREGFEENNINMSVDCDLSDVSEHKFDTLVGDSDTSVPSTSAQSTSSEISQIAVQSFSEKEILSEAFENEQEDTDIEYDASEDEPAVKFEDWFNRVKKQSKPEVVKKAPGPVDLSQNPVDGPKQPKLKFYRKLFLVIV